MSSVTDREEALLQQVLGNVGEHTRYTQHLELQLSDEGRKLAHALVFFLASITFGTIFYALVEPCSCSFGATAIAGCVDTNYDTCVKSGGSIKTFAESFYFSVITLTTVGFGDFTPLSHTGRWVGIFWMLLGVASTGNFISQLASFLFEHQRHERKLEQAVDNFMDKLDADRDGCLSRAEHHLYMLKKQGILTDAMYSSLERHFEELDVNLQHKVTIEQLSQGPELDQE
eukprot:TRINITY_DN32487_c0_g1_i1.p1 TRINITY_DN32487_c0_g1~~TRINITY_DN32487_c0_g1_i1.p1  ORF type:complete len:229 (+),score=42.32 TRINITY_DN32487_c0_g1_i1:344-1030(+)